MTQIVWDQAGSNPYEAGVDRGVFYPRSGPGIVWNGLASVQESPSDADEKTRFIDGVRTRTGRKPGDFAGTIEAFMYPNEFEEKVLARRYAPTFGMTYRTRTATSHKIHLVYNILLGPTGYEYQQDDTKPFGWTFTTTPAVFPGIRPTAHLIVEAAVTHPETFTELEEALYGTADTEPYLPSPDELMAIFEKSAILQIVDNGDGTWTAYGPDSVVKMLDATTFQIDWPSVVYLNSTTYQVSSL